MKLTADQFSRIIKSLQDVRGREKDERRRAPRAMQRRRATITLGDEPSAGQGIPVVVRDLSSRGIGFIVTGEIDRGAQFIIDLERPSAEAVHVLCTVVHSRPVIGGSSVVGAEFTCLARRAQTDGKQDLGEQERIRRKILA